MTGFANLLAGQRFFRLALIAGSALLGVPGLGSAILVFVAILKGWQTGLSDLIIALLVFLGIASLAGAQLTLMTAGVALSWALALLLGVLTGRYQSLVLPVQVLLVITLVGALLFTVWVDDPVAYWTDYFQTVTTQMTELGLPTSDPKLLAGLAPQMTGIAGAGAVMSAMLALVVGVWWAGRDRPRRGFPHWRLAREFAADSRGWFRRPGFGGDSLAGQSTGLALDNTIAGVFAADSGALGIGCRRFLPRSFRIY